MKRISIILLTFLWTSSVLRSQSPSPTSSEILLGLKKLNTIGSVLYIAAHPDDENTRLLSYLANERKLRAGYLSITRGDGGQNLIGSEQGELLGLIRTQELLAARKKDGAEQFFTRANDFGYSKNPEETFAIWNKDSVLADMVWVIRKFKPDVIICRFPTTGEGGHGHHTASALLAEEAFEAAADAKRFPEQLKYVSVWKTKRLFWNTFNFGSTNTTAPDQLKIDVGIYNPLLGKGYGEIAAESRSMHKSQGFGSAKGRGTTLEYFKLLKGDSAKLDLFDGIDLTWQRFPSAKKFQEALSIAISKYDVSEPSKIVPDLVNAYRELYSVIITVPNSSEHYWKEQKLKEIQNLILQCAGIWVEAYAQLPSGVPGNEYNYSIQCIKRSNANANLNTINYFGRFDTTANINLKNNELLTLRHKQSLAPDLPYSSPYWLNESHPIGMYTVNNKLLVGNPENISNTMVYFQFTIEGTTFQVIRPVMVKSTDPVKGEVYRPHEILPPATVNTSDKVYISMNGKPTKIKVKVKANKDNVKGIVLYKTPYNWITKVTEENCSFHLLKKGDEKELEVLVQPNEDAHDTVVTIFLSIDNVNYNKSISRIEYDHIPYQFILNEAKAKLIKIDLKKTGTNIGYIPGAGDDVADCLRQIGYTVTELSNNKLANDDLSKYNAIVTGVRAYNTNDQLPLYHAKLMEYVKNGGNYIVQYNTNNNFGKLNASIGPYPFTVSRERVTDENAKVEFDRKTHPVYTSPNLISSKDFDNWIQERGIYFVTDKDEKYETIFSMNDKDEKPLKGSLIYTHYGKGNFVYTGLAFFRQLPAGVPGAYRLFVNLLSLPKSK
jgi:LmbE family N-acetylglucosaminyl deacetylase